MRLFFFMLLLLNVIFFGINSLREVPSVTTETFKDPSIPQLVLLTENKPVTVAIAVTQKEPPQIEKEESSLDLKTWISQFSELDEPTEEQASSTNEAIQPKVITAQQCFTAGPFQNSDTLQQAASFFNNFDIIYEQRSTTEKQYIGMLVYLPSHPTRKAIVTVAESLAAKGVKDYMLLNEPGKNHALSLGVFSLKKNAKKRIKTLSKLNYNAKSEARYRKKSIFWLDYVITPQENKIELAAQQMNTLNVSQIQRNCPS